MNNKGFAVTAVIYGLSILGILVITILMGTLSASRTNIHAEAKKIEKDLVSLNRANILYTSGTHKFRVPMGEGGWYRIEAFGRSLNSMPGAYTTGIIYLPDLDGVYVDLEVSGTKIDTIVKALDEEGPVIMKAAAPKNGKPGSTLKAYSDVPQGGDLNTADYRIKPESNNNLLGTENITYSNNVNDPISVIAGYPGSSNTIEYKKNYYYFVDGLMLPAANNGVGKVIITRLAKQDAIDMPTIPRINPKYDHVQKIIVENGSGVSIDNVIVTCNGEIKSSGRVGTGSVSMNIGGRDVDDISVLFDTQGSKFVNNVKIIAESNDGTQNILYSSEYETSGFTSNPTGIKLSAYQIDYEQSPPRYGNYYLIPVLSPNKVVSGKRNMESEDNELSVEYMAGEPRQKWSITQITSKNVLNDPNDVEYYLSELSRHKALAIYHDQNITNNKLTASMTFNNIARNVPQIWVIDSQLDGTYSIKTTNPSYNQHLKGGFITIDTSRTSAGESAFKDQLVIGQAENPSVEKDKDTKPTLTERFYFYNLDFGIYKGTNS